MPAGEGAVRYLRDSPNLPAVSPWWRAGCLPFAWSASNRTACVGGNGTRSMYVDVACARGALILSSSHEVTARSSHDGRGGDRAPFLAGGDSIVLTGAPPFYRPSVGSWSPWLVMCQPIRRTLASNGECPRQRWKLPSSSANPRCLGPALH